MIFYLPIYRKNHNDFEKWVQNKIDVALEDIKKYGFGEISEELKIQTITEYQKKYGRSWEQNRAVGWLKICKAEKGFVFILGKASPFISKLPKKFYELLLPNKTVGGLHNISFSECITPEDVLNKFHKIFKQITSSKPFEGCYIDDSQIMNIYVYVNWIALINK